MIVLDTDVFSGWMRLDQVVLDWLDRQPSLSVWTTAVTLFELRSGLEAMPESRRRRNLEERLEWKLGEIEDRVLSFDVPAAEVAGRLAAQRRRAGIVVEMRDTQIAGIVLSQKASLATRNVRHFNDLDVPVVDPWSS